MGLLSLIEDRCANVAAEAVVDVIADFVPASELKEPHSDVEVTLDEGDEDSFPEVVGVLRSVERPVHHELVDRQGSELIKTRGAGNLQDLLTGDETWTVQ